VQIVPFWAPWRGLADRDLRRLDGADRRDGCREQLVAAEPGPPRSQRHHERAGRRLYERIEAVAATIEAEWAEQAGAPRLEELRTTLSDLLTPRQGQPVRQRS
jgi:hypothetical protein